jgi:hypothetical protein
MQTGREPIVLPNEDDFTIIYPEDYEPAKIDKIDKTKPVIKLPPPTEIQSNTSAMKSNEANEFRDWVFEKYPRLIEPSIFNLSKNINYTNTNSILTNAWNYETGGKTLGSRFRTYKADLNKSYDLPTNVNLFTPPKESTYVDTNTYKWDNYNKKWIKRDSNY